MRAKQAVSLALIKLIIDKALTVDKQGLKLGNNEVGGPIDVLIVVKGFSQEML